jgi:hypothetical protein
MRITPHVSHTLGRVGGERRCTRCWSAPDWDIIEEACPTEGDDDVTHRSEDEREAMPPWSETDVADAYRMYMAGESSEAIGARFGRTVDATTNRIANYRAKHGLPPRRRRPGPPRIKRARMDEIAMMPGTLRDVARATGTGQATVIRARAEMAERTRRDVAKGAA